MIVGRCGVIVCRGKLVMKLYSRIYLCKYCFRLNLYNFLYYGPQKVELLQK